MTEKQIEVLEKWFIARKKTITAFSGGIDSSLVLYLSKFFLGKNAVACISNSASLKRNELEQARDFCQKYEIKLEVVQTEEMSDPNYLQNPSNRCYYCKNHLYISLNQLRLRYPEYILLNGVNADDLGDYRPGLQAAAEHNIQSPLVDCNIDKEAVREIAKHLGLEHWNKPASPCLSSRIPYGSEVNREKLNKIEGAEAILNKYGFADVRVRYFDQQARVEVPSDEIDRLHHVFNAISQEIQNLGFKYCTIDNEGLVSGKLNRVLNE